MIEMKSSTKNVLMAVPILAGLLVLVAGLLIADVGMIVAGIVVMIACPVLLYMIITEVRKDQEEAKQKSS
jgi:uncharacterized membrane protein